MARSVSGRQFRSGEKRGGGVGKTKRGKGTKWRVVVDGTGHGFQNPNNKRGYHAESAADATAAKITGNPYGLARALDKIEKWSKRIPLPASPAMSHMFIIQPLAGGEFFMSLFSTHPPVRRRIERLIGRDYV